MVLLCHVQADNVVNTAWVGLYDAAAQPSTTSLRDASTWVWTSGYHHLDPVTVTPGGPFVQ